LVFPPDDMSKGFELSLDKRAWRHYRQKQTPSVGIAQIRVK